MAHVCLIAALTVTLGVLLQLSAGQVFEVSNIPQSVAAESGMSTLLNCVPQSPYEGNFAWRFIGSTVSGDIVYLTPPYKSFPKFPSQRFRPYGNFGLNITSLQWSDGGTYVCAFLDHDAHGLVDVVVIDPPTLTVTPPVISVGDDVTLSCSVGFGGPINSTEVFTSGQFPYLQIMYGSEDLTQQAPLNYVAGKPYTLQHKMSRTIRRQVSSMDIKKQLKCTVFTRTPSFSLSSSADINIRTPASDIVITPLQSQYALNDMINCTASGYPAPTVNWVRVNSSSLQQQPEVGVGPVLLITEDMKGYNIWKCVASNQLNREPIVSELRFTVDSTPFQPAAAKSNVGLAVGLAIGIAVLIIVIIVVVVCVIRRRRAPSKQLGKTNETDEHPFIYKPNSGRLSSSTKDDEDDDRPRPVPKPRINSSNTALDTSAGGFADLGARGINASTDSLHKFLDKEPEKPRTGEKSRRRANPRGSTESLDRSLDESGRPIPKERPKTDFRGSNESLDRAIDGRPQPKERPRPNLRASNESLDKSVESNSKLIQSDRSRLSSDRSFDGGASEHSGKPRPATAPKPNKVVV